MHKLVKIIATCALVSPAGAAFAEPVATLTDADLQAYCSNERVWKPLQVQKSDCLKAAKQCADKTAGQSKSVPEATQRLYACVFDALGITLDD